MTEVLEQKIEDLTNYVKSLDVASRAENSTYKSILEKISHRLNELETDDNVDIVEIKDRIKFLTSQIEEFGSAESMNKIQNAIGTLKDVQDEAASRAGKAFANAKTFQTESMLKINEIISAVDDFKKEHTSDVNGIVAKLQVVLDDLKQDIANVSDTAGENQNSIGEIITSIEDKFAQLLKLEETSKNEYTSIIDNCLEDIKAKLWEAENHLKTTVRDQIYEYSAEVDIPNKLEYLLQSISTVNKDTSELVGQVEALKYTAEDTSSNTSAVREYLDSTRDDLKNNLRDLQEQFVMQMLQIFENVSFETETEEILDFVDETGHEIKEELETLKNEIDKISQKDDSEFFNSHFNNLCDLVTKQTNSEFNLLSQVASEIKKITANTDENEEQIYSLPDIENDLAKIRLVLKELQNDKNNKDEYDYNIFERFDILNEDISSISKRTNKLILTAGDANKEFKVYLEEFKDIIRALATKNRQPFIEQKLDSAIRLIISNAKSSQVLNEAFMQFAEWVDATSEAMQSNGELVETIDEKSCQTLLEIDALKNTALENEQKISGKLENIAEELNGFHTNYTQQNLDERMIALEKGLAYLNEQYEAKKDENKALKKAVEKQNTLIAKLEEKIAKFEDTGAKIDKETKSVIEYIASQMGITAENTHDNKDIIGKIEFLEHKINSLDKNIQKIISYIDEA